MSDRLPGYVAIGGGILWLLAIVQMGLQPLPGVGAYRDVSLAQLLLGPAMMMIDVALATAGTVRQDPNSRYLGRLLAGLGVVGGILFMGPWPIFVLGLFTFMLVTVAACVRYVRARQAPAWVAVAFAIASVGGWVANTEDARIWLLAPIGVVAVLFGVMSALRPRPSASIEPA